MSTEIDYRGITVPRLIVTFVRGFGSFCLSIVDSLGGRRVDRNDPRQEFRTEIWKLRRLLHTALGQGVDREIIGAIGWLARNGDRIERAVVAWVDLIEVLVQAQERRYGSGPGLGRLKKDEMKEVIRALLVKERLRIPHIPDFLVPAFLNFFVDWVVDAVVLMENRHGMWEVGRESHRPSRVFWAVVRQWLRALFRPVWAAIVWTALSIGELFRTRAPLSPELAAALTEVQRNGVIPHVSDLISGAEKVLLWISVHRVQLIAAFELILAAVHEAERFIELPGAEKKAYAQSLVLAVLDEMGLQERTGLLFAIVDSLIGSSIEAAVNVFNKRGVFVHRGAVVT